MVGCFLQLSLYFVHIHFILFFSVNTTVSDTDYVVSEEDALAAFDNSIDGGEAVPISDTGKNCTFTTYDNLLIYFQSFS